MSINSEKKHVLLISGDPRILAEIKMELIAHFHVSMSAASSSALNALDAYTISAVVICIGENSGAAFSDFHDIFERAKNSHIPILFIAEKGNDDDETKAFAVGAVDYSARRRGTVDALVSRINLRINASEHEKLLMMGESFSPTPDEVTAEQALNGKTFLIVDDVGLNRQLIKAMLEGVEGLTVDEAADGKEAFEMFKSSPEKYSLILMDIQMPVMDGLEATMAIRELNNVHSKNVPIIALTAASLESEVKECMDAGMNDFIVKPMAYDDLIVMAAEHCS
ncbi:MAG: response regulator [Oscillospiraceae bacterium]|nr:response regulator [Oscillospiraceae bacterium]